MIEHLKTKIENLKFNLTQEQQKYLHFKSIDNFLFHFQGLENYQSQLSVKKLLEKYFDLLDCEGYVIDKKTSTLLGKEFIWEIGHYYVFYLNFKIQLPLLYAIFIGLHIDILLLILSLLKYIKYILIVTLVLFAYWIYVKIFFENRRKVYAIRY